MPKRTAPPKASDHNKYITVSRLEISQILHALAREATQVTANLGGDDFFLTSVMEVDQDSDQLVIESGTRNPHKTRILAGQQIACTASLEKIQIRFQLDSIELAETDNGEEVFVAPLPRELFRMQRREYFRMMIPMLPAVTCSISLLQKEAPPADVKLTDISCGGIAVIAAPELLSPELGARYECILKLPGSQPLNVQLQARYKSNIALANKKTSQRAGFQFIDLPESAQAVIQRYLMQLELARRARSEQKG